jgi:hypothetical protein
MSLFERLEGTGDWGAALEELAGEFRKAKNYPGVFEARLMRRRLELGLPVIQTDDLRSYPVETRQRYEQRFVEVAREVGQLYLDDGQIERAWAYFRAIGEPEPVVEAIERLKPTEEAEAVIGIAFQEGLHPRKGLELILARHGMCRAITAMGMYAVEKDREACITLLIKALYGELRERLRRAIASQEGELPEEDSVVELVRGRDWLFGEWDSYVDTSHAMSVVQYVPELTEAATLKLAWELCEYGRRLSKNVQLRGTPPYEEPFVEYGYYAGALLGIEREVAIAELRRRVEAVDVYEVGTGAAQMLVKLLVRLERYGEALEVALKYLGEQRAGELLCPAPLEICRLAGDYDRMMELARERGDILSWVAAQIEKGKAGRA